MNLKRPIIALVALALFPFTTCLKADDQADKLVKGIRSLYSSIEDGAKKSKAFSVQADDGPEEGKMTIYLQNGKLAKIHISYILGDHGGSDEYFYYNNGELFFAYLSDSSWRFSGKLLPDGTAGTTDRITEYRLYLNQGKFIRSLKKTIESSNPNALKSLIKKAKNEPCNDLTLLSEIQKRGTTLSGFSTSNQWKQYLLNGLE